MFFRVGQSKLWSPLPSILETKESTKQLNETMCWIN
jgi:hypothetical protein